mmetsp:Transcript_15694/g.34003  ORF Transcript_15694/g.34003 Transcript_15694/m.34003 type:complete len:315 (-) Transcript_15694:2143-3087(-)
MFCVMKLVCLLPGLAAVANLLVISADSLLSMLAWNCAGVGGTYVGILPLNSKQYCVSGVCTNSRPLTTLPKSRQVYVTCRGGGPCCPAGGSMPRCGSTLNWMGVSEVKLAVKGCGLSDELNSWMGTVAVWSMAASMVSTPSRSGSEACSCISNRHRPPEFLCTMNSTSALNIRCGAKRTLYVSGWVGELIRVSTGVMLNTPASRFALASGGTTTSCVNPSSGPTWAKPVSTTSRVSSSTERALQRYLNTVPSAALASATPLMGNSHTRRSPMSFPSAPSVNVTASSAEATVKEDGRKLSGTLSVAWGPTTACRW